MLGRYFPLGNMVSMTVDIWKFFHYDTRPPARNNNNL